MCLCGTNCRRTMSIRTRCHAACRPQHVSKLIKTFSTISDSYRRKCCFADFVLHPPKKEVMFSGVSVCLFVCLYTTVDYFKSSECVSICTSNSFELKHAISTRHHVQMTFLLFCHGALLLWVCCELVNTWNNLSSDSDFFKFLDSFKRQINTYSLLTFMCLVYYFFIIKNMIMIMMMMMTIIIYYYVLYKKVKRLKLCIAFHRKPISELRGVTCHMGSHSVTSTYLPPDTSERTPP